MRLRFTCWAMLLLPLLLSGCASDTFRTAQRAAAPDAPFALNGRVAVRHDGERTTAGLRWTHRTGEDEMLLLAPLGQAAARIRRDAQGVLLEVSGKTHTAPDAETLTRQVLGWELPLAGLSRWVVGLPSAGSVADIRRNADGQIATLHQDGWDIDYSRYATSAPDSLPVRLVLRRERLEILLLVDEWEKQ